jgi:superfamily II DNA or RNA helicase
MEKVRMEIGHSVGLVCMATASGKTVLAALDVQRSIDVMRNVLGDDSYAKPSSDSFLPFGVLFLVHTRAIRDSAYAKFKAHFSALGYDATCFQVLDNSFSLHKNTLFVFGLLQSFDRIPAAFLARVSHVIIDEVHHVLASSYRKIYDTLLSLDSLRYMLGMTATLLHRTDPTGDQLRRLFRNVVYVDMPWTLAKQLGFFPSVEYLETLPTLREGNDNATYAQLLHPLQNKRSTIDQFLAALRVDADTDQMDAKSVVNTIISFQNARLVSGLPPKRRIMVFAATIGVADSIATMLSAQFGLKAEAVHYKNKQSAHAYQEFVKGKLDVLVSVDMLNEGFDVPGVDCIVFARTTDSEIVFAQQLGRGLRKDRADPDKQVAVLDMVLNLRRRWKRLRAEVSDEGLLDMVLQFWHVGNFVGDIM